MTGISEIPGAIFQYTAEGDYPACVAFTGSESAGRGLYSYCEDLRACITLIHADPKSLPREQLMDITLDTVIDDIEKARKALGIKKIGVMGHSMFGIIPLEYALKYPDNASYAISSGSSPKTTIKLSEATEEYWESEATEERKRIHKENLESLAAEDVDRLSPSQQFKKQYIADIPIFFRDPEYEMPKLFEDVEYNMDFIDHYSGVLIKDFDNTENYRNIQAPVLIIAGRYDFACPYYLWDDVKAIIPDYTFHLFENAGHNPMLVIPEEFDRVIVEWIESKKSI